MSELIDFVENTLDASADQIKRKIERSPGEILARKNYVLDALNEVWAPRGIAELSSIHAGELRPVFSGTIESVAGRAVSRELIPGRSGTQAQAMRRRIELQTLLLYAHSVAVQNPLSGRLRLSTEAFTDDDSIRLIKEPCGDREFLVGVYAICDTAALARKGILQYFDLSPLPTGRTYRFNSLISRLGRNLWLDYSINVLDQSRLYQSALAIFEQALFQALTAPLGSINNTVSLLIPTDLNENTFLEITRALSASLDICFPASFASGRDTSTLQQLCRLSLPGVEDIKLRDVAAIREDDAFAGFRLDLRAATNDADEDLNEGRLEAAQQLVGDHMQQALAQLDIRTRRGVLSDAITGDLVGWGFGAAAAAAIAGWQGMAATLLGKGAAELVRASPSKGMRARRSHYVALSDKRSETIYPSRNVLRNSTTFFMRNNEALEELRQNRGIEAIEEAFKLLDEEDE
jgi:hypothetical protein